mmetsp:Transcript_46758/g.117772  ORF Transcript_46758/g.117772 Transcript_46758/m.117772 type:complete len:467 (-) Transcript_46758:673-2073(-)|eukprot:CAMPEP_0115295916 /NCGR_PEP_ID=MMETSP0270-20121206/66965_1 /TAXON_ID=71861 /ORGANISM="Scrippsiella trochoidea, Strain CCMP3099" /LENGTH=466 /DNA_ID=CAMNT_0002713529 /DNA_START=65 /DNA_END=1465 /DNA_ORIENTATION=+
MPAKRPEPLSEEFWDASIRPGAAGATLLGRTQNVLPTSGSKKQLAEPLAAPPTLAAAPPTPGTLARLTPIGGISPLASSRGRAQPQQWAFTHPFTPIATPSPTGRYSLFHRGLGSVTTPGSKCAMGLSKSMRTPRGDAVGSFDQRADEMDRSAAINAHASLFSRSVTYAISPTSARATGLAAPPPPLQNRRGIVSLQQALMPDAPEQKPQFEGDEDDDESGDEGESQPQALRRPEDVPKPPPGALHPSLGSEGHGIGACKRCCFFPRGRCMNGYECMFCHYEHEKRKRKNKKKNKRATVSTHQHGVVSGVRPLMANSTLGLTMPGHMLQARSGVVMPAGYPSAQMVQVLPQQGQFLYSAPQVISVATQQDLLAPYHINNGAYCVMQPQQTLVTAPALSAYSGVQQSQQLIVLEPASMPQPQQSQQPQHSQQKQHLEPPPPPPRAPGLCQAQSLPPPPSASPKFWAA